MNEQFQVKVTEHTYLNVDFWQESNNYPYSCNLRSIPFCCGVHVLCNFKPLYFNTDREFEFLENCFEWSLQRTRLLYLLHNENSGKQIIDWALSKGFAIDHKVKSNTPAISGKIYVLSIKGNKP